MDLGITPFTDHLAGHPSALIWILDMDVIDKPRRWY